MRKAPDDESRRALRESFAALVVFSGHCPLHSPEGRRTHRTVAASPPLAHPGSRLPSREDKTDAAA